MGDVVPQAKRERSTSTICAAGEALVILWACDFSIKRSVTTSVTWVTLRGMVDWDVHAAVRGLCVTPSATDVHAVDLMHVS